MPFIGCYTSGLNRKAVENAAIFGVPPLLALLLYRTALRAWFQADDFVWLNLLPDVHSWSDLSYALFHPTVHGTWRPLGERIYFLSLQSLFGYSIALPFRIVAFAVQFANMVLISLITLRLTRSRIAAFLAPLLWISSDKLVLAMVWNSAINYVFCGFFVLLALWFLLRYIDTNRTRDLVAMWVAFLLGLGAMEMAIAFPIMAALYTWLRARPFFKKTLPLLAAALAFAVAHVIFAPNRAAGLYSIHFDFAIFRTLADYWALAFEPVNLALYTRLPAGAGIAGMIVFSIALLGYSGYQAYRRNFVPLIFLGWFLALLLPVLPLRENVEGYYLTLPLIGLAMLASDAFAHAWSNRLPWRVVAVALVAFFLFESGTVAQKGTRWYVDRSLAIRTMVMGVAEAHRQQPDHAILLQDVDDALFWAAIDDGCFQFLGLKNVYLAPGSESHITPHPEIGDPAQFALPAARVREVAGLGKLSVYDWQRGRLKDVTEHYLLPEAQTARATTAQDHIDIADPLNANRLSQDWYPIEQGMRWSPRRASVRMLVDGTQRRQLHITGYCPGLALKHGPVHMTVSVDGAAFPAVTIDKPDALFEFEFPLTPSRRNQIEVTVEFDRTLSAPGDQRQLGMAFGVFEIR